MVGCGEVVDDVGVVCLSFFSSVAFRRDRVSDEPLLDSSSSSSFLGVVVALVCIGLRRGDLNGLESVEAAFSARRRFPAKLTEAILMIWLFSSVRYIAAILEDA